MNDQELIQLMFGFNYWLNLKVSDLNEAHFELFVFPSSSWDWAESYISRGRVKRFLEPFPNTSENIIQYDHINWTISYYF